MHFASGKNAFFQVKQLIGLGADQNLKNLSGETALMIAKLNKFAKIENFLSRPVTSFESDSDSEDEPDYDKKFVDYSDLFLLSSGPHRRKVSVGRFGYNSELEVSVHKELLFSELGISREEAMVRLEKRISEEYYSDKDSISLEIKERLLLEEIGPEGSSLIVPAFFEGKISRMNFQKYCSEKSLILQYIYLLKSTRLQPGLQVVEALCKIQRLKLCISQKKATS